MFLELALAVPAMPAGGDGIFDIAEIWATQEILHY